MRSPQAQNGGGRQILATPAPSDVGNSFPRPPRVPSNQPAGRPASHNLCYLLEAGAVESRLMIGPASTAGRSVEHFSLPPGSVSGPAATHTQNVYLCSVRRAELQPWTVEEAVEGEGWSCAQEKPGSPQPSHLPARPGPCWNFPVVALFILCLCFRRSAPVYVSIPEKGLSLLPQAN